MRYIPYADVGGFDTPYTVERVVISGALCSGDMMGFESF